MEFLRGPLYLDVAAKGLCFVGVVLMIFGRDGWFMAGVVTVVLGVLAGAWELFVVRKMRPHGRDALSLFRSGGERDRQRDG